MDTMAAPRQQFEARSRARLVHSFGEDAPSAGDDRVSGKDVGAEMTWDHRACLLLGEARGVSRWQLVGVRGFVDFGRIDPIGEKADLLQ
jgi:hypothetical protein